MTAVDAVARQELRGRRSKAGLLGRVDPVPGVLDAAARRLHLRDDQLVPGRDQDSETARDVLGATNLRFL